MKRSLIPESLRWLAQHPLFRIHPIKVSLRWMYWQGRRFFTQRPMMMDFVNGSRLRVRYGEGLTGYWYVMLPDYDEQLFLLRFLRREDCFYDVGANAGAFTTLAASLGCTVVGLEPVPHTFERLLENVKLNEGLGDIRLIQKAAGAEEGALKITTHLGTGNHLVTEGDVAKDTLEIQVTTLDILALSQGFPSFIKIDVEGFELEVLQGAGAVLQSERLQGLLIETFRPSSWQEPKLQALEKLLSDHGFKPYEYVVDKNVLRELSAPHLGSSNTFYFRDPLRVEGRLNKSVSIPRI
ncbi:FkbM family methyltransferase [Prosthecobacter dejongeii]|uniref:FkbM family methyltransferase n=1 Tax=Prosthecobacter dejongeii TaxID=48465 RepID=A0A7W7YP20_9BACT|nr:FkbM family methyltransferase [Prosthecobacter dejongeii]MBB5039607.1 FkbM family methyltransferase [Prosthecobacter dejongeii]